MEDRLDFIAEIIKSLTWPTFLILILFMFKNPLTDVLNQLANILRRLPYLKRFTVFNQTFEIDQLEQNIVAAAERAMVEIKRSLPSNFGGRLLSYYESDEITYYVHMIETLEKIGFEKIADPAIYNAVGQHYFFKDKDKSKSYYQKAKEIKQNDVDALTNLAFWHLYFSNDVYAAYQECDAARQIAETDGTISPWTYGCLGYIYKRLADSDKMKLSIETAKEMFQHQIEQDKSNFWAYFGLGWCASMIEGEGGGMLEAIAYTNKCLVIKPDFQAARFNLACFHACLGDADSSVEQLRMIVKSSCEILSFFEISSDDDFKSISDNPTFLNFLETIGSKYQCET